MKDDHEDEGMTNPPQQKDHREGAKENKRGEATATKDGGESKKQGEGEETAASGTTSTTGSALVGAGFGMRFAFDEQCNNSTPHTNTREGGGRNKEEKGTNTPQTLATTRVSPEREGKSRKRTLRKADNRSGDSREGDEQTHASLKKTPETKHGQTYLGTTRTNLNPDAKQPTLQGGAYGDKQITTVKVLS